MLFETPVYALLAPATAHCDRGHMTLVPRSHVLTLGELDEDETAAVLAGLSKLSEGVRRAFSSEEVAIRAHPVNPTRGRGHLHFHVVPKTGVRDATSRDTVSKILRAMTD